MTHIGKVPLEKETWKQIYAQLKKVLLTSSRGSFIFGELLTDVEKIMLAKRLAAILLLIDGNSYYRIEQVLGMSTSTSQRLHQLLLGGAYTEIETIVSDKKTRDEAIQRIGILLRGGLPPRHYVIKKRSS